MIKKLVYIFIPILAVLLMSHNANAVSPVIDLSNYDIVRSLYSAPLDCELFNMINTVTSGNNYCRGTINNASNVSRLDSIYTSSTYNVKKGDILTFFVILQSWNNSPLDSTNLLGLTNSQLGWNVLDYHVQDEGEISPEMDASGFINWPPNNDFGFSANYSKSFYKLYQITLIAIQDGDLHFGLKGPLFSWNVNKDLGSQVNFKVSDFKHYRYNGSDVNKEQSEATQDAANNSATSGSNSSTNSQTATNSLLSVITSGIGAITSASPTNCKINGNMGNLNVGNIDLCANPVPTFMALIGSIIAVLVVLPLVILLFNRFISIIRSFQR